MNFGEAMEALKAGKKVARRGWNGKGMFICTFSSLSLGIEDEEAGFTDFIFDDEQIGCDVFKHIKHYDSDLSETGINIKDCFCMFTADREIQIGWLASQADMFAEDWDIL